MPVYPTPIVIPTKKIAEALKKEPPLPPRLREQEEQYRKQLQEQIRAEEEKAKAEFEASIRQQREAATTTFQQELTKGIPTPITVETELSKKEREEQSKLETQLKKERQAAIARREKEIASARAAFEKKLGAERQKAKREFLKQYKRHPSPAMLQTWEQTQKQAFETRIAAETAVFQKGLTEWERGERGKFAEKVAAWRTGQLEAYDKSIEAWRKAEAKKFEAEMSSWEEKQRKTFAWQLKRWKVRSEMEGEIAIREWKEELPPPSLAERILAWKAPKPPLPTVTVKRIPIKGGEAIIGFDIGKFLQVGAEQAVYAGAGFVGGVESFIYGVGRLARRPTPRMPPTAIGAVITSGIETAVTRQLTPSEELKELGAYGVPYAAATLIPEVVIAWAIGKGIEISPIGKPVARAEAWVARQITKPFAKMWKGSRLEMALIRRGIKKTPEGLTLYKGYAKKQAAMLAPERVIIPRIPITKEGYMAGLEAVKVQATAKMAWELTQTPHAAGILWTPKRVVTAVAPKVTKRIPSLMAVGVMGEAPFVKKMPPIGEAVKEIPLSEELRKAPLAFERYKWRVPVEKEFMFVKGKLPSLADLIKETKAETTLLRTVAAPKRVVPAMQAIFGAEVRMPSLYAQIMGVTMVAGLKALRKPRVIPARKPIAKEIAVPALAEALAPAVAQKVKVAAIAKPIVSPVAAQILVTPLKPRPPTMEIPPPLLPPITEKERRRRRRKRKIKIKKGWGLKEYLYPVRGVRSAAKWILGKD